jgi:methylthioribose-1-phosphate isomerase
MADVVGRATGGATAGLLGLLGADQPRPRATPTVPHRRPAVHAGTTVAGVAAEDSVYRSPFRLEGATLRILDQRGIPERLDEVVARRGSDVVHYLRRGICSGGPLIAQLAAYGLALTAAERASQPEAMRDQELVRTRDAFLDAKPASRLLRWALARQQAVADGLAVSGEHVEGAALAAALRSEADAIAGEVQLGLAATADALGALLADVRPDGPIGVLLHGNPGALQGGLVGSGITALRQLHEQGRELRIVVTESLPSEAGLRLASWELRQAGIDHTVVPDTAVAWILEHAPIDAVLIAAESVAANGDCVAVLGSRAIGRLVADQRARSGDDRPRLLVAALAAALDPDGPDGSAIPADIPLTAGRPDPRVLPASDVIAAAYISLLVTERGAVAPVDLLGIVP